MSAVSPSLRSAQAWTDRLANLVWCVGIADQLAEIGAWLGQPQDGFPPSQPQRFVTYDNADKGVSLRLHYPFWDRVGTYEPNQWLIADVIFDPVRAPLPFGLDAERETLAGAADKLSHDYDDFPATKVATFYLDDNRAVTICFRDKNIGLTSLRITRLYGAIRYHM